MGTLAHELKLRDRLHLHDDDDLKRLADEVRHRDIGLGNESRQDMQPLPGTGVAGTASGSCMRSISQKSTLWRMLASGSESHHALSLSSPDGR